MNYLHLDFKGAAPSARRVEEYLAYFRDCGYDGVIVEFDCRVAWRTWPEVGRPIYTCDEASRIVRRCRELGMEAIPLIQTLGHLEWILTDPRLAHLREADSVGEACPQSEELNVRLRSWIDEAIEIFDHPQRIHLGADEAYVMGACPKCRERVAADPRGAIGLYLDHVGALCRYAKERGASPMIWGDMLKNVTASDHYSVLPHGTVIFDWGYYDLPEPDAPWKLAAVAAGVEVWGASAVMCGWSAQSLSLLPDYPSRLKNLLGWHQTGGTVLHTTWGRPSNTWPLYCPWPSLIPLFAAGGGGEKAFAASPWRDVLGHFEGYSTFLPPAVTEAVRAALPDQAKLCPLDRAAVRYIELGLRWQELLLRRLEKRAQEKSMRTAAAFVRDDCAALSCHILEHLKRIDREFVVWCDDVRDFFAENELADVDEFLAERRAVMMI